MLAVIRTSAFYSYLRTLLPFVPRGSYLALLDVAAKRQAKIDRIYHRMKELESIYGHSIAQCKEQHDSDAKLVNELNLRCCRQAQLLRQMRKLTDEAALSLNHVAELS